MIEQITLPRKGKPIATNKNPEYIVIHHDGVIMDDGANPEARYIADTFAYMSRTGYPTTPYHFMISRDGRIFQGLELNEMTYHCSNYSVNLNSIAITFQGNYEYQKPTFKSLEALNWLLSDLKKKNDFLYLSYHRKLAMTYTACPGLNLIPIIENINFNEITMTKDEAEKIVYMAYRHSFGREPKKVDLESWSTWLLENSVSALLSAFNSSPEEKDLKRVWFKNRMGREMTVEESKFYLDAQPNGMTRTIGEMTRDLTDDFENEKGS